MYAYLHDQTLRLAAHGKTPGEIAEEIHMPASLERTFATRGYYGTTKHNARAVYQFYFGWFDGNPSNLDPLPPTDEAARYVDAMGGTEAVVKRAQTAYDGGEYRWAATLLRHVVFATPGDEGARELLARTYDQLGYQAESGPWRDVYLTGAQELRHGIRKHSLIEGAGGIVRSVPTELFFDAMATRLNGPEADGKEMTINFVFTDLGETHILHLENAVLHHHKGEADANANATLTLTHPMWLKFITRQVTLNDMLFSDELSIAGSRLDLIAFFRLLDEPNESFAIVTR
jgi:alkyl sulfatase BDS1-like metallo-beta-lactamase superfamily hydrolase